MQNKMPEKHTGFCQWGFIPLLMAFCLVFLVNCAAPLESVHKARPSGVITSAPVLVVNFKDNTTEFEKDETGWWLSKKDLYKIDNLGFNMADALRSELKMQDAKVFNYRQYKKYQSDWLKNNERETALSYLDWARLIGAEYVVFGRVQEGTTLHNRTFHTWRAKMAVQVYMQDVSTGSVVFSKRYALDKKYTSLSECVITLSRLIASDLSVFPSALSARNTVVGQ